jgi:hypothetical protein
MRALILLAVPVLGGVRPLGGAEPVLTHVFPAGVQRGLETDVKLVGKFDPWPCRVWTDAPGIVFTPGADAGVFKVAVAADVPAGPHLLRAVNAEGASVPVAMVVADSAQTLEVEPNDDYRSPQVLPETTATVNGRHEKADDVDSFGVTLARGQVLVARIDAYVLAATFDAMLRVVDDSGSTLAFNHDHVTMDPFLVFTAPRDGRYAVQTMGHAYPASTDIRFAGGETCLYRLHLSTAPVVRNTWPLAVTRGAAAPVTLEGWNLASTRIDVDPSAPPAIPVTLSDIPEVIESPEPQVLAVPSAVSGRLEVAGGEDRHAFDATKDRVFELAVTGRHQGSEIDPWLKIRDHEGKELAAGDDDGGSLEPRLVWTAPADGRYTAVVGDVTQRGGPGFFYRLSVRPATPSVSATVAAHAAKVEAGKSAEVKVVVARAHGFQSKLKLAALGLPAGVAAAEVDVPEAGGEVALTLAAEATAPAAGAPFRLVLRETDGGREHPVIFSIATTSENNGVPQGYQQLLINATDQLWLTVVPPPPPAPDPPATAAAAPATP